MPKEVIHIKETVMASIQKGDTKMRPKFYFVLGSVLTFLGAVLSIFTSIILIGLMRFSLRAHGPMAERRVDAILSSFPWWVPILAIIGLLIGVWLVRKYEFAYKLDFKIVVVLAVLAVFLAGLLVDIIGFNDLMARKGPMRGVIQKHFIIPR